MPSQEDHAFDSTAKLYGRAARAELERDYDRAFQLYVKAAEEFLHLSRTTADLTFRATCKAEAGKALERAEKIKNIKRDLTPVTADYLSEREQFLVLQKSSIVNGTFYPLWTDSIGSTPSTSILQPPLSPEQLSKSAIWCRCATRKIAETEHPLAPQDVVQDVISDCSVCASIALCIDHNRRFKSKLASSAVHPQNADGVPTSSTDGRYHLRLLFNGAYRRIDIDDELPTYPDGTLMCMSAGPDQALWPSLCEKAYMKLMGGYDFPGSLSSTDLHTLIGWIPEYVDLTSADFEREKIWRKILIGFQEGLCMLTVGTGKRLPVKAVGPMSLIPVHCYAVIDILDSAEERTMTVLDTWTGSSSKEEVEEPEVGLAKLALNTEQRARSCTLSWDVVCSTFEGICLSWNPALFTHEVDFHGSWKNDSSTDVSYPHHFRLQLKIDHNPETHKQSDVWLLLTRHVVDSRRTEEYISLSVQNDDSGNDGIASVKGEYSNGTHVLIKTEYSTTNPAISVIASYDGSYENVGYTISAYSCAPMTWAEGPAKLLFRETVTGTFTIKSAGGNPTLPTFMLNPQYHLRLYPQIGKATGRGAKARVNVALRGDRHMPLSVALVWSQGQRITEMLDSETAASSGPYNYGYASFSRDVPPGDYTVIVSAYEPRHTGTFALELDSSLRFDLSPIAQEGAGMFSKILYDSWTQDTAAGGPSFKKYTRNPIFKLDVPKQTQIIVRLQLTKPGTSTSINVTIFNTTQNLGLGYHIATSGPYSDAVCGVVTPQVVLQPGLYYIIPSTFKPGIQAGFKMFVYTSASGVTTSRTALPVR